MLPAQIRCTHHLAFSCLLIAVLLSACGGGSSNTATHVVNDKPASAISVFAGAIDAPGYQDGAASNARFAHDSLSGMAIDIAGNIYVADRGSNTIRKITPGGNVTTLAGTAGMREGKDGNGAAAGFFDPSGIAVDRSGNVYVADFSIRKITPDGKVSTLPDSGAPLGWDGMGNTFGTPYRARGVAVDSSGNVYASYTGYTNTTIQKISPTGVVTTFAGMLKASGSEDGTGAAARFSGSSFLATDNNDNVYVAETNSLRKITPAGVVTTVAGSSGNYGTTDGTGAAARFTRVNQLVLDKAGSIYVSDENVIRKISPNGTVTNLAGTRGNSATQTGNLPGSFQNLGGLAVGPDNQLYAVTTGAILKIPTQ
jgi:sugar lactone lactonase YvrE